MNSDLIAPNALAAELINKIIVEAPRFFAQFSIPAEIEIDSGASVEIRFFKFCATPACTCEIAVFESTMFECGSQTVIAHIRVCEVDVIENTT